MHKEQQWQHPSLSAVIDVPGDLRSHECLTYGESAGDHSSRGE
jgi:hypothetical protein